VIKGTLTRWRHVTLPCSFAREKGDMPSPFTMKLRKQLRARTLEDVRQVGATAGNWTLLTVVMMIMIMMMILLLLLLLVIIIIIIRAGPLKDASAHRPDVMLTAPVTPSPAMWSAGRGPRGGRPLPNFIIIIMIIIIS
jgi:hypothetical protein